MNEQEMKKQREEKFLEAVYHNIGSLYIESASEELENIEKMEYPASLDEWFYGYLEELKKKEKKKMRKLFFKRQLQRAAIVFVALTIGFTSLMVGVEAFRVEVMRMFFDVQETYTEISFKETDTVPPELLADMKYYYYPEYIPKGYELVSAVGESLKNSVYKDSKENELFFIQTLLSTKTRFDTEGAIVEDVIVSGLEGVYVEKDERKILLWHDDEMVFQIIGQITKQELLKMAESMKFVE